MNDFDPFYRKAYVDILEILEETSLPKTVNSLNDYLADPYCEEKTTDEELQEVISEINEVFFPEEVDSRIKIVTSYYDNAELGVNQAEGVFKGIVIGDTDSQITVKLHEVVQTLHPTLMKQYLAKRALYFAVENDEGQTEKLPIDLKNTLYFGTESPSIYG